MIALLAGIGLGSIVAAVIGWFVAISNHRQAWINALRDDIATYLKELETVHYAVGDTFKAKTADELPALQIKLREARVSLLFVHRRILLRLNRNEALHIELANKFKDFDKVESRVPEAEKVDALVDLARRVLKREWEVTKLGPLAKPIMWWRERRVV